MKSTTWEGLLSTGIKGLGMLGGPVTSFAANILADPIANAVIPDDKPLTKYRQVYPQLGPDANTTQTSLADPINQKYTEMPEETPADRIIGTAMPLIAGAMPLFAGGSQGGALGGLFGKSANVKVPTPAETPKAAEGAFIPSAAPTHEEGGVKIEVEGGELVLNAEQQAYIDAAPTPEEKALRYQEVQNFLKQNSVPGKNFAQQGLYYTANTTRNPGIWRSPNMPFDLSRITKPEAPLAETPPAVVPEFEGYMASMDNVPSVSAKRIKPQGGIHGPFIDPNQQFDISGMSRPELSLYNYTPGELEAGVAPRSLMNSMLPVWTMAKREQGLDEVSPASLPASSSGSSVAGENDSSLRFIDMAKKASSDTRRKQNLLDASALGIVLGSLVSPEMPVFDDLPNTPLQAPEYKSYGRLMESNLNKALATTRSSIKDRGMNERIAMEGNLLNTQMGGYSEIAKHEIDVSNANRGMEAETANKQIEQDMAVLLANRQAQIAANEAEYARKRELLAEAHKLGQTMFTRSGRDDQNQANMEMLEWLLSKRGTPEFDQLMSMISSMSAGGASNFNALFP